MSLNKVIRDGKVAVLYTASEGTGWSTIIPNWDHPQMIFDPHIVEFVEADVWTDDVVNEFINSYLKLTYPGCNFDGLCGLEIAWVKVGDRFKIVREYGYRDEYYERVEVYRENQWLTA